MGDRGKSDQALSFAFEILDHASAVENAWQQHSTAHLPSPTLSRQHQTSMLLCNTLSMSCPIRSLGPLDCLGVHSKGLWLLQQLLHLA